MIHVDGSIGEGGGQVLRTSLALSLVTGRPFRIEKIRAGREKPGLLAQHLTAVEAAAEVGQADVQGAVRRSDTLRFTPAKVRPGEYRFSVGTAGSATLVLQTVLPALVTADGCSRLRLEGGTHNAWAPPFDFLEKTFLPVLRSMGPSVRARLERYGFYPAGGGALTVEIEPAPLLPLQLGERGRVLRQSICAVVSRLPTHIAQREVTAIREQLGWPDGCVSTKTVDSSGPGNCVLIEVQSERITEVFTGFGRKGVPAEQVALGAARQAQRYLDAGVPVGEHLADQLLIPMAVGQGGTFRTLPPSPHTMTNIRVTEQFLDARIRAEELSPHVWQISVQTS